MTFQQLYILEPFRISGSFCSCHMSDFVNNWWASSSTSCTTGWTFFVLYGRIFIQIAAIRFLNIIQYLLCFRHRIGQCGYKSGKDSPSLNLEFTWGERKGRLQKMDCITNSICSYCFFFFFLKKVNRVGFLRTPLRRLSLVWDGWSEKIHQGGLPRGRRFELGWEWRARV